MKVLLENFKEKIEEGDSQKALDALDLVIEKMPSDGDLITEILTPAIITEFHELLIEHLEVKPRAMQLNRRFPSTQVRAMMFAKAMRNGISHTLRVTGEE